MGQDQRDTIDIRRGKLDSLTIYEVSERELEVIEKGSGDSIFLNFGVFLLSVCVSFIITLFTVDFFYDDKDDLLVKFIVFLCVAIISGIGGIICLIAWRRNKGDFKLIVHRIKKRAEIEKKETDDDEAVDIEE